MRKVWVVVANRAEMKLYTAENVSTLLEIRSLSHTEGKQSAQNLTADKQGSHRGSFGTDTMEERTPTKMKEATTFAVEIAQLLEEGFKEGAFERLYLVAGPEFMGLLRQAIKPTLAKLVEKEIDKDVVQSPPEQIRSYLPPVL